LIETQTKSHLFADPFDGSVFSRNVADDSVGNAPRMREILNQTYPGVIKMREYAGYTGSRSRKTRMSK
jgi:hypothetical protein